MSENLSPNTQQAVENSQEIVNSTQNTTASEHSNASRSTISWRKRICRGALICLFVLLTPLLFLLTGKGQRTAVELADKFLDQLTVGKVEGSLQEGLTLSQTQFVIDGVNVDVGQADLHVNFGCLLEGKSCVEKVALKDTVVAIDTSKLPPSQDDPDREPFTELNLPLGIEVNEVTLDNVQVKVDDLDIALAHFYSSISGNGRTVTLEPTEIEGLTISLAPNSPQAVEKPKENANSAEKIDWQAIREQLAKPILTKLEPIKLPLDLNVEQLEAKAIHIEQKVKKPDGSLAQPQSIVKVEKALLKGQADEQNIALDTLELKSDRGNLSGKGSLNLSGNYPLDWRLTANSPLMTDLKIPASEAKVGLTGELFGKTSLDIQTKGAVNATLQGSVQLAEPKTPLALTLKNGSVQFPFIAEKGQDPLKLQDVNLTLKGDLLNYQLDAHTKASGMYVPASEATLKGKGEISHFNVDDLALNALEGKANLNGKVDWADGVEWQSNLKLAGVNTKSLLPEWAAVLSGSLSSTGYAARGNDRSDWRVETSNVDLKGTLFQKNLQLQGDIKSSAKTLLDVPAATLIYGENRIAMKGILGEKSDFSADIKAPNLQGLVPNLKAGINGSVKLSGKVSEPNLDLDLTANNVNFQQLNLQHLIAKGKITTEKAVQGNLELGLRQFSYGEIKVENASLTANGSEANHNLKLSAKGDPVGVNLQISGKFDRSQQHWQGQLSNVAIQTTEFGTFQADKTIGVSYNNPKINANITSHCWRNPQINLCFPTAFNAGQEGKVPFEIRQFDLASVQKFLDKHSQLSGLVNAKGEASWFKAKQPIVNVELTSNALKFLQKMEGGKAFPLSLSPVKITANLAENNLKLKTDVKVENNGRLTSDLLMKDVANSRQLSGSLNIDALTLQLIKPLLGGGEKVDGNINARLTLGGSAAQPQLHGKLGLTQLKARANAMPFDITGGEISLNFHGSSSTLTGRVQTTESELHLSGDADWRRLEAWRTRVKAQANRFRVDVPNIAKVDVSPNIEVTATPKALILGGTVDIPWARIEVEELPDTAVSVSDDEVIMDGSAKAKVPFANRLPKQTAGGMAIQSDIQINIGKDVKLNAYGLKADLHGKIAAKQGKQGLGLYGQVNIDHGRYASFGQDLLIRKGMISFAGLPSQPTLNIEAIRNPEAMEDSTVTAGIKVTGFADSPEVKLFSNPSKSQDQILSYIMTGRSLENSGEAGSSNSMAAALLSMSLAKSSKAVGSVGSAFGLNDLSVSTAGFGDNTKVEVGASLTPKFRVKYGVGIFAPLTELTLRYNLAPRLYLQWMSSINQAVDLMYRVEFD